MVSIPLDINITKFKKENLMTQKISITRALVEVKTLDSRIQNAIQGATFVSLAKGRNTYQKPRIAKFSNVEEVQAVIKSDYQAIGDLIERRSKIKAALAKANVETLVKINGKEIPIVQAIDQKTVIEYKSLILQAMINQINGASNNIEQARTATENDVKNSIEKLLGTDVKNNSAVQQNEALIKSAQSSILDLQELSLIDPLNIKEKIKNLQDEIQGVVNEIDFALSEINAKTEIEV